MSQCNHDHPTPEEDYEIGYRALQEGDVVHAAHHVAGALAVDPMSERYRKLADSLASRVTCPLDELFPKHDGGMYVGAAALKAYLHAARKEATDALQLLIQVAMARPEEPWLEWAQLWFLQDGFAAAADGDALGGTFSRGQDAVDWSAHPKFLEQMAVVLEHVARATRAGRLVLLVGRLLRMNGRPDRALEIALAAEEEMQQYWTAITVANALRHLERTEEALRWFETAHRRDPSDDACLLDIGDLQATLGRFAEALVTYEQVLATEPENAWALPSALACRAELLGRSPESLRPLIELTETSPQNERAQFLLRMLTESGSSPPAGRPYVDYLPARREALLNGLRSFMSNRDQFSADGPGRLKLTLNALEAPSAFVAMRLQFATLGWRFELEVGVDRLQDPDPRRPRSRGFKSLFGSSFVLWRYDGLIPQPAVPAPPAEVYEAIAALARTPYKRDEWWTEAGRIAGRLRERSPQVIAAVAVHPMGLPETVFAGDWVFAVQMATAFVLAWHPRGRSVLEDILLGPLDWTAGAAAIALAEAATGDAEASAALFDKLIDVHKHPPSHGEWCLNEPVTVAALRVCTDAEWRRTLEERLAKLQQR